MTFAHCKVYAKLVSRLSDRDLSPVERDSILRKLTSMNDPLLYSSGPSFPELSTVYSPSRGAMVPHRYYHNTVYENVNGKVREMTDSLHTVDPSQALKERLRDISQMASDLDESFWRKLNL